MKNSHIFHKRYFIKTLELRAKHQQQHNTWLETNPFFLFSNAAALSTL